jgi:hypothetical protein
MFEQERIHRPLQRHVMTEARILTCFPVRPSAAAPTTPSPTWTLPWSAAPPSATPPGPRGDFVRAVMPYVAVRA